MTHLVILNNSNHNIHQNYVCNYEKLYTICNSIIDLLSGSNISLESKHGEGSMFKFSLWMRRAKSADDKDSVAHIENFSGTQKILLVDDNYVNRLVLKEQLASTGIAVDEAENGTEACQKFAESAIDEYGLILMDVQMPIMNGHEATARIRAMPRPDAKCVPIIAVTANAFKEDMYEAVAHGMTAHMAKPVEYEKLMQTVSLYFKY